MTFEAAKKLRVGETLSKSPHPAFDHLLPSFGREKAKLCEIIAFSRAVRMGEGGRRPDEGPYGSPGTP